MVYNWFKFLCTAPEYWSELQDVEDDNKAQLNRPDKSVKC